MSLPKETHRKAGRDMKDKAFGIEVELTGITRAQAAETVRSLLGVKKSIIVSVSLPLSKPCQEGIPAGGDFSPRVLAKNTTAEAE